MILNGVLETPRLSVRPFVPDDIVCLVALFGDSRVAQFVSDGQPLTYDDATAWVSKSNDNLERFGFGTGAVVERENRDMIGWAGIARPEDDAEEIIFGFERPCWNQGYGQELVPALSELALARGIDPVRATVDRHNVASVRLLIRCDFALAARDYRSEAGTDLYELHGKDGV